MNEECGEGEGVGRKGEGEEGEEGMERRVNGQKFEELRRRIVVVVNDIATVFTSFACTCITPCTQC